MTASHFHTSNGTLPKLRHELLMRGLWGNCREIRECVSPKLKQSNPQGTPVRLLEQYFGPHGGTKVAHPPSPNSPNSLQREHDTCIGPTQYLCVGHQRRETEMLDGFQTPGGQLFESLRWMHFLVALLIKPARRPHRDRHHPGGGDGQLAPGRPHRARQAGDRSPRGLRWQELPDGAAVTARRRPVTHVGHPLAVVPRVNACAGFDRIEHRLAVGVQEQLQENVGLWITAAASGRGPTSRPAPKAAA